MTTPRPLPRTRRILPLAAVVTAVAVATAVGGYAWSTAASGGPRATPSRVPAPSSTLQITGLSQADQVAPLKRVVPPDVLAVGSTPLTADMVASVRKLKGVEDVMTVDAGAVQLGDHRVNTFAVDPSAFRSWTPPGTAKDTALWSALAADRFVVSEAARKTLGVQKDYTYQIVGRQVLGVRMGGSGPLGLPGIDMLVSRKTGASLQLIPSLAVLVNAPGTDTGSLVGKVKKVLGGTSTVLNLHESKYAPASNGKAATYMDLYRQAAAKWCPGLSWSVLAAIGQIESDHGRNAGRSSAGALGPMQFLPSTWKAYGVDGDGDGKADITDPYDAVPGAAHYLCANGAGQGGKHLYTAIFQYNHADWYVQEVLALAALYRKSYGG